MLAHLTSLFITPRPDALGSKAITSAANSASETPFCVLQPPRIAAKTRSFFATTFLTAPLTLGAAMTKPKAMTNHAE